MMGCEVCSDLEYPKDISSISTVAYRRVFSTADDLWDSAAQGCPSCSLIRNAILAFVPDLEPSDTVLITICLQEYHRDVRNGSVHYGPTPMPYISVTNEVKKISLAKIDLFRTRATKHSAPSWESIPIALRLSGATRSADAAAYTQVLKWLYSCRTGHRCDPNGTEEPGTLPLLPHRIVDVGSSGHDKVRLRVSKIAERAPYLCLSHCWGKTQIVRTLGSNIHEFETEIPWHLLSKTFQDAILVARTLEYRYIWIDSLCIIQDSAEDWLQESSNMFDYYGRAELTLAATSSAEGSGGLFRDNLEHVLRGRGARGEDYLIHAREHINHFDYPIQAIKRFPHLKSLDPLTAFPLLKRGWVYQERMLSPRVLHFGSDELVWECLDVTRCECHEREHSFGGPWIPEDYAKVNSPKQALAKAGSTVVQGMLPNTWRSMVMNYTKLDLTYGSDKLPALQGCATVHMGSLARSYAKHENIWGKPLGRTYIAGLWCGRIWDEMDGAWRDSIFDDLLWHSEKILPRPTQWRAPSFSWASVDSPVIYPSTLTTLFFEKVLPTQVTSIVKEAVVEPVAGPFGPVTSAYLRLSGVLVQASLRYSASSLLPEDGPEDDAGAMYHVSGAAGDPYLISSDAVDFVFDADYAFNVDGPHQVLPGTEIYVLRISHRHNSSEDLAPDGKDFSLVLRLVDQTEQKYERIGLLNVITQPMLDLAEKYLFRGRSTHSEIVII